MPVLTETATISAAFVRQIITLPLDYHILKSATALDIYQATQPNSSWVEIGIMQGGELPANKIAVLSAGYLSTQTPVAWTGSMPVEPGSYLYAECRCSGGMIVRLSCILWKIVLQEGGRFIVDP